MNKTLSRIVIGVTLLLIIVAVGRYAYSEYPSLFPVPHTDTIPALPSYIGSLIMTLQPSLPANSIAGLYSISVQNGTLKKINDSHNFFAPSVSPDGLTAATVMSTDNEMTELTLAPIANLTSTTSITPPAPTLFAGHSVWSPDGKYIAYEALTALQSESDPDINTSRIVLLNRGTSEQVILDTGSSPAFLPDGSVLYLKADGVYHVTYNGLSPSSTPERVVYVDDVVLGRTARIAVSSAGDILAFTNPDKGEMTISRLISDATEYRLGGGTTFPGVYLWPTFSPDDKQVAAIQYYKDTDNTGHKSLSVFEVDTHTGHSVALLDSYGDDFLSIGAWVK